MAESINTYSSRVRAHQTDLNGAMHHAAYLDLFDDARIETFRRLGYDYKRMQATTFRPVIRHIECDYLAPAFMDDLLTVTVHVTGTSPATLVIRYECRRDDTLLAVAQVKYAFVDVQGRPVRVPADLRVLAREHLSLPPT